MVIVAATGRIGGDLVEFYYKQSGLPMRQGMSEAERQALTDQLAHLRQEHRDLDDAILALEAIGAPDKLQIQRLKKRKLMLKDEMSQLSDRLLPDIIA